MGETGTAKMHCPLIFLVSLVLPSVLGHGALMWPPSWFDPNGTIGLTPGGFMTGQYEFAPNMWYTNWTFIPGEATLDPSLYTFPDFHGDAIEVWDRVHCFNIEELGSWSDVCPTWYPTYMEKNPWMAPGSAEVFSPCGIAGGNPYGIEGCDDHNHDKFCTWGGYSWGPDARDIDLTDAVWTGWPRGETVEVGWGLKANHGGGYSYRLCKVEKWSRRRHRGMLPEDSTEVCLGEQLGT